MTGIRAAYTDIKYGFIFNWDLKRIILPCLILNILYYAFFVRDIIADYLINLLIVAVIQMILYKIKSYAGGDLKLGLMLAALYPARFYLTYNGTITTLFFYIGIAIFYGYLYLFIDSIIRSLKHQSNLNLNYIKNYLLNFLLSYCRASIYIIAFSLTIAIIGSYVLIPSWFLWILSMWVAFESQRKAFLKNRKIIIIALIYDVVVSIITKTIPFSLYPETYVFTACLLVLQMIISSSLYETIETENIKKGMILSTASSLLMQGSRVKGLPRISHENLDDRLNDEEADSIRRWAKTKKGRSKITIMRKIPFAVFLLMGMITYFIIWLVIYDA